MTGSVAGLAPSGVVTLSVDGAATVLTLNAGVATLARADLAAGVHSVSATYGGDTSFYPSNALPVTQTVQCGSVITVANTADSGAGSLRRALIDVCPGGTIVFSPTLNGGNPATITLASMLEITQSLTISGPGASLLAVSGDNGSIVFNVNSGVNATIAGLTIRDGQAVSGGGINNTGTLTVANSTISGNEASLMGGGIYNYTGGTVTVNNSTFSNNDARFRGGGIWNQGAMTVNNSTFSANGTIAGDGDGIYNETGGTLTVNNSTLSGNDTIAGSGNGITMPAR